MHVLVDRNWASAFKTYIKVQILKEWYSAKSFFCGKRLMNDFSVSTKCKYRSNTIDSIDTALCAFYEMCNIRSCALGLLPEPGDGSLQVDGTRSHWKEAMETMKQSWNVFRTVDMILLSVCFFYTGYLSHVFSCPSYRTKWNSHMTWAYVHFLSVTI